MPTEEEFQALLEAERQRSAQLAADLRHSQVATGLKDIGAPDAFADIVPTDLELSADALRDFVSRFLPAAPTGGGAPEPASGSPAPDLTGWARYERASEGAGTITPPAKTDAELLLEEGMEGLRLLRGEGRDWNHLKPPDDMQQKNAAFAQKVNRLNRSHEMAVRRGEAAPGGYFQAWGFGGRHDPPQWAYVAEDGIRE
jgi:hypothetical protein